MMPPPTARNSAIRPSSRAPPLLAARTVARRLSSVSGLFACLAARGDTVLRINPVPRER